MDTRSCTALFENRVKGKLSVGEVIHLKAVITTCKTSKRGGKPPTHTVLHDGNSISNDSVVIGIRFILAEGFVCFGYDKITDNLRKVCCRSSDSG